MISFGHKLTRFRRIHLAEIDQELKSESAECRFYPAFGFFVESNQLFSSPANRGKLFPLDPSSFSLYPSSLMPLPFPLF